MSLCSRSGCFLTLGLGLATALAQAAPATLAGKVTFTGVAPQREIVKMSADPYCANATQAAPFYKDDLVVNANGTLAHVFVAVTDGVNLAALPKEAPAPLVFDQTACHYIPHVLGIRVDQMLKVLNSDSTFHNVHAIAKANASFNNGMTTKGQILEKKFSKPERMVRIKCDVHGWMNAYVGVMEHPFFSVTDDKGTFSIANLPPGEYTVEAWHEKLGTKTQKVKVAEKGGKQTLDFSF